MPVRGSSGLSHLGGCNGPRLVSDKLEPRDPKADEVPLAEAAQRFVDPQLLQHRDELAERIASWPRPGTARYRQGWPDEDARHRQHVAKLRVPVREAHAAAEQAITADLRRQLLDGSLIATGLALPLTPASCRTEIACHLWKALRLRPGVCEVVGRGLRIVEVRVRRACSPRAAERHDGATGPTQKRPGPNSIMPQITAEMRARAERGELKDRIGQECRALEQWAKANYPAHPRPPKAKSIQNVLGKLYYELLALSGSRI